MNNIKVIAMQETRIPAHNVCIRNNYTTYFSGNMELGKRAREYGVGIAVHVDWQKYIKHVEPVNNRIMWIYIEDIE